MANALGLDRKYERNLRRLATYLWHLPKSRFIREHKFNMWAYASGEDGISDRDRRDCGSVGCALGHAPFAGISKLWGEDWDELALRQFGTESELWQLFFSCGWVEIDNTPRGTARRILYCLKNGYPPLDRYETREERFRQLEKKYRRYRPRPEEFVKLSKTVLRRLGLEEQDAKTV